MISKGKNTPKLLTVVSNNLGGILPVYTYNRILTRSLSSIR